MNALKTILAAGVATLAMACTDNNSKEMDFTTLPLITVEEHFAAQEIIDANAKYAHLKPKPTGKMAEAMKFFGERRFIGESLMDIGKKRLPHMDSLGIGMQILSYTAPIDDVVPVDEAVRIARRANDILAEQVAAHPGRFRAMATLPMGHPQAAAAELERCVKELGFVGVLLTGTYKGRFYDEPEFFPIFEKAAELDVPVYWHPDFVNRDIIDYYYMSDSYSAIVGAELGSAGFGWHIDVGIHVARMVVSGIFDKLPNLKFVTGHWGEDIPAFLERMDYMLDQEKTGLKKKVSDYYKDNIWYTPSGIMSEMQLDYFVKLVGAEHIIWSEDYPYLPDVQLRFFLEKADLTPDQKYAIARGNAEKIFKLNQEMPFSVTNKESGKVLRGTLYKPEGEGKKPLIVCSHELGSDGMRPWWVNYANHWVNEGYAVVAFDFSGGGERSRSEGETTDMSVLTEVSDLETVLAEVEGWDFVDRKRIILVGGSQGGGVATITAARHPGEISALVLLYPAFYLPEDLHRRYPDLENIPETDDRGMITIGKKYILDMYDYDYRTDMQSVRCPVLIVHGNQDQVVSLKGSEEAVGIFPDARLHVIERAGHVFMTAPQQEEFLMVADEFLESVLK